MQSSPTEGETATITATPLVRPHARSSAVRAELRKTFEAPPRRWPALGRRLLLADVIAAGVAGGLAAALAGAPALTFTAGLALAWCSVAWLIGLYAGDDFRDWASGLAAMHRLLITGLVVSWPLYVLATAGDATQPALAALVAAAAIVPLSGAGRTLARAVVHRDRKLRQRVLVIGSGVIAVRLAEQLRHQSQFGLDCVGFIDDDPFPGLVDDADRLGGLADLPHVIESQKVDRVAIAFSRASHEELLLALRACRDRHVAVDIVPRLFEFLDHAPGMAQVGGLPLISVGVPQLSRSSRVLKRALDLVGGIVLAVATAPMVAAIAIAIKLESRGPVLFTQVRMGQGGRPFRVYKFRSMYQDADRRKAEYQALNDLRDGVMFKIRQDPRVTRVGRFLRKTSLDEFPQIYNVIRGDMSLVGPRPLILPEAEALQEAWHARRLDLRPGMTGPWQVAGRSELTYQEMLRLDYSYVSGWTLVRDIEMLFATVPAVLSGRGAY